MPAVTRRVQSIEAFELHAADRGTVWTKHRHLGERWWYVDGNPRAPALLFTENETNSERLFGVANPGHYVKDAFHEAVIHRRTARVNPAHRGTKAAAHYSATVEPGESFTVRWRFTPVRLADPFGDFAEVLDARRLLLSTQLDYVEARANVARARAGLESAAGVL